MTDRRPEHETGRRGYLASLATGVLGALAGCNEGLTPTDSVAETTRTARASATSLTDSDPGTTSMAMDSEPSRTDVSPTETPQSDDGWSEGGPPDRDGWTVTFADRFDGGELDGTKWAHGAGMNMDPPYGTLECWESGQTWADAETNRPVVETTDDPSADRDYTSGGIHTRNAFAREFGYFEAKARPPAVPGSLPAFWIWWNPDDWGLRRETDFYEILGVEAQRPIHNVRVDCERRGARPRRGRCHRRLSRWRRTVGRPLDPRQRRHG